MPQLVSSLPPFPPTLQDWSAPKLLDLKILPFHNLNTNSINSQDSQKSVLLKLNRPKAKNALNSKLLDALLAVLEWIGSKKNSDQIRVMFLEGSGDFFCSGGDVKEMMQGVFAQQSDSGTTSTQSSNTSADKVAKLFRSIDSLPFFTICIVNGPAYGGGLGLISVCDYAVVVVKKNNNSGTTKTQSLAEPIKFSFSEVKIGMVPATICPHVMKKIGYSASRRLMLTGQEFGVDEALLLGLVHQVVEHKEIVNTTNNDLNSKTNSDSRSSYPLHFSLFQKLVLPCAPNAVKLCKRLVKTCDNHINSLQVQNESVDKATIGIFNEAVRGSELKEGAMAIVGKTKAGWAKL